MRMKRINELMNYLSDRIQNLVELSFMWNNIHRIQLTKILDGPLELLLGFAAEIMFRSYGSLEE